MIIATLYVHEYTFTNKIDANFIFFRKNGKPHDERAGAKETDCESTKCNTIVFVYVAV